MMITHRPLLPPMKMTMRRYKGGSQDPLEDVEVYVAYGRYPQAVDFLRNEINKSPERADLKVRLLELLKEMGDDAAFQQQAHLCRHRCRCGCGHCPFGRCDSDAGSGSG